MRKDVAAPVSEDAAPDIAAARLDAPQYRDNFADIRPPLDAPRALIEAARCLYCYDAPCVEACPTAIDVPGFIRKLATGNLRSAGVDILEANIFGGSCARICPTEILCEEACVRNAAEGAPVRIGLLQRYATDPLLAAGETVFERAAPSGWRVAVVGAGPAGLSCAHALARRGHDVTVFEARGKPGGLNEFGVAAYKLPDGIAQAEIEFILSVGGIVIERGKTLGEEIGLAILRAEYDAVFLGLGQTGVRALGLAGERLGGVEDAVRYIERLRQTEDVATLPVGRRIVVIGGGNTAIDIAAQTKRLGAEEVTIAYRRGPEAMGATGHERDWARANGVVIRHHLEPRGFIGRAGQLVAVEFADAEGRGVRIEADQAFKAVGQLLVTDPLHEAGTREVLELRDGRILVDGEGRTSLRGVYAGGDCTPGRDLTVRAVADGKRAAAAIDRAFAARGRG